MGKLSGEVKYKKVYSYSIYSFPLGEYREEAIQVFDNRWRNGERCFGVDSNYAKDSMDSGRHHYFIVVNEKNTQDYASATISVKDECQIDKNPQAFIYNLCRHGTKTSVVSPVKVLFDVIGKHVLQRTKIKYLYLNPQPGEGIDVLINIYKKYGFRKAYCPKKKEYTMRRKINLKRKKTFSNKNTD